MDDLRPPVLSSTDQWLALILDELRAQRGAEKPPASLPPATVHVKEPLKPEVRHKGRM